MCVFCMRHLCRFVPFPYLQRINHQRYATVNLYSKLAIYRFISSRIRKESDTGEVGVVGEAGGVCEAGVVDEVGVVGEESGVHEVAVASEELEGVDSLVLLLTETGLDLC